MPNWKNQKLKNLSKAISVLNNPHDIAGFLRDLCTMEELEDLSKRWDAVLLLAQGKTQRKVAKMTNLSTTTVTRISFWLNHGEGGYKKALENLQK